MPTFRTKELTHVAIFGVGSTFSKGLESAFSEGSCPDPGPLYKVFTVTEKNQ